MLDKDQVKSVKVTDNQLKVTPKNEGNPFTRQHIRYRGSAEIMNW